MFRPKQHITAPADPIAQYTAAVNRSAVAAPRSWSRRSPIPAQPIKPPRRRRWVVRGVLAAAVILVLAAGAFVLTSGHGKFSLASLLGAAAKTAIGHKDTVAGQAAGRTNILVYGMTQDGLRTDSIILVSYYWQQKKIVTLNIPRDLYVYDGYENAKMGEVYAYAVQRQPKNANYPDQYVANLIAKEYNIPINYWVQFNMQGEVDFVNAIGGIDVNVPDAFTDCEYPTWNYSGYVRPCPHFNAGEQHMNGSTALIFSRSRHSLQNNEGTDFARSHRQQLVIAAIMTKLKGMGVVGNLPQISHYLDILGDNITTSMSTGEMVSFATAVKDLSPQTDYVKAAWATGNGFLCDSQTTSGEYVTLYGSRSSCAIGSQGIGAGGAHDSESRQLAVYFVQHLLSSAPLSPDAFVTTAETALGYATPTPSPAATQ